MNIGFEKISVYFDGGESALEPGRVIVEPLERGFGTTLGNMMRRNILAFIPGASVIGLKIPGVLHQFAVIDGSATDCTELIQNLKKLRFKVEGEGLKTIKFSKKEAGFYSGADLQLPEGVEIRNPEQRIINLTGEKLIDMQIYVRNGRGYVDASLHREFVDDSEVIAIDGVFSPIRSVGYDVQQLRVGQNTNYEKLVMTIITDGSVHPRDVAMMGIKISYDSLEFFKGMSDLADKLEVFQEKQEEEENRILDYPIEHLDLTVRSFNGLRKEGYLTIRQVYSLTEDNLYNIPQLGEKSVEEIMRKMEEINLPLRKR